MKYTQESFPTAVLTGATGAIGEAIAIGLADLQMSVILIARNPDKAAALKKRIIDITGNQRVSIKLADLSRNKEVQSLAASWTESINILINNAAIAPETRMETPEGIETQFATNVLGYFWMIHNFQDHLVKNSGSRIVNVASYWAGELDLNDLEFKKRPYHNHTAYRQSKQANRMLTPIFAENLQPLGISVNACHPGDVNSQLSNDLGFGGSQSPQSGASTPIWLATSPEIEGITGKYFEHQKEVACPYGANKLDSQKLFDICDAYPLSY